MSASPERVADAVAAAYTAEWTRVLSTVVRAARNFDVAEDCVQDAYAQALLTWERDGIPDSPGAWLTTVAVRKAIQLHRRDATLAKKLPDLVQEQYQPPTDPGAGTVFEAVPDDRLRLIFTCCHPALSAEARIALTLRLVCGLTSAEVAKAFLVKEATMQARITRAKKKIADAGIAYRTPTSAELPERLASVLDTVLLVYNAGHIAPAGAALMRTDLADRALQIARMLRALLPDDIETAALLALLLLTDARRTARVDDAGDLVQLERQDRSRWDREEIEEGLDLLRHAASAGSTSRYVVMASLAAVHDEAPNWEATDWPRMVALYDLLLDRWPSPVVALNRAIAIGMADGPEVGLSELAPLMAEPALATYPYLAAARADFLRRLGRNTEAVAAYGEALLLTANSVEATYLRRRLEEVQPGHG
ncbi:MAG: RNA polymerase sigma factor [Actinomycetota bacterium]|nr:RNA polymerase sigma factor [Actinomycetota bacterium]